MTLFYRILLISTFIYYPSYSQDLFNLDNTLEFAEHLKSRGEISFALEEYNRAYFLSPDNTRVQLEILSLNRELGLFSRSIDFISKLEESSLINKEKLYCLLRLNKFKLLDIELNNEKIMLEKGDIYFFTLSKMLLQERWKEASKYITAIDSVDSNIYIKEYYSILNKNEKIKNKNPYLAGALSVFIPGLGKLYTGDRKDALFSLFTIGLGAWQTYDSFTNTGFNSVSGWIYGGMTLFLYSGNIYGSYSAAKNYNYNQKLIINEEINHNIETYIN